MFTQICIVNSAIHKLVHILVKNLVYSLDIARGTDSQMKGTGNNEIGL